MKIFTTVIKSQYKVKSALQMLFYPFVKPAIVKETTANKINDLIFKFLKISKKMACRAKCPHGLRV